MNRKIFLVLAALGSMYLGSPAVAANKAVAGSASLADFIPQDDDDPVLDAIQTAEQEQEQEAEAEAEAKPQDKDDADSEKNTGLLSGISSGIATAFQGTKNALMSSPKEVEPIKRSNASVFDIAGVMLQMNRQQVEEAIQKHGYRRINASMEIPNFIRWRYEEMCRNKNVIGYERLNNCVVKLAQKNNYQYVEHMTFNNFRTKETVSVNFTSNFTGNKAYYIEYRSTAADIRGNGPKASYLRNIKIFDFWKKVSQKYGAPDNKEKVTWGMGFNKPSLKAETGHLILQDPMLLELDRARMSREDQKFMHTAVYTF